MKEEALKLADEWDWMTEEKLAKWGDDAQAMIRRLVEELDKEKAKSGNLANSDFDTVFAKTALGKSLSQTKPLSNQEILKFIHEKFVQFGFEADYILDDNELIDFVRTIEERHGIK